MFWWEDIGFRPVEKRDLEDIRNLRNDPSTWMHLTTVTQVNSSMQERWFESIEKASDKAYFSVFKQVKDFPVAYSGDFIGIIRCDQMDGVNRSIRVGADVVPGKRGKGYGTKILGAILAFYFQEANFHRVWLCVLDTNTVAKRLYEKVGFKEEGIMREAIFRNGVYHDYVVMSILENEYRDK